MNTSRAIHDGHILPDVLCPARRAEGNTRAYRSPAAWTVGSGGPTLSPNMSRQFDLDTSSQSWPKSLRPAWQDVPTYGPIRINPFGAPEPLPILNLSNFVPKNGLPVVKRRILCTGSPIKIRKKQEASTSIFAACLRVYR